MTVLLLPAMAAVASLLLALGVTSAVARTSPLAARGSLVLCGLGALLALAQLAFAAPAETLVIGIGLPGMPITLALDGLSAVFLLGREPFRVGFKQCNGEQIHVRAPGVGGVVIERRIDDDGTVGVVDSRDSRVPVGFFHDSDFLHTKA